MVHTGIIAAFALIALGVPAAAQDTPPVALPPTVDPCAEEAGPEFVMPTTGVSFTLPSDCAPVIPPPVRPPAPSLFRMVAMPIGDSAPARKWERARSDTLTGIRGPWNELLSEVRRVGHRNGVEMVNRWVNWHVRYRDDTAGDEWASAPLTLARRFGDCEDYALAKMGLLLELGVPADDMFLVLLRDNRQVQHAVLAVKQDGRLHVLDNRTDKVLPAETVADYTPILSFSGIFAWTYGNRAG